MAMGLIKEGSFESPYLIAYEDHLGQKVAGSYEGVTSIADIKVEGLTLDIMELWSKPRKDICI